MVAYSADFETITTEPTRVWLWAICPTNDHNNVVWGKDIEGFMDEISKAKYHKSKIYFHNLKFDGMFIMSWLLNNDTFTQTFEKKLLPYEYTTLISKMGQWYQIKIRFNRTQVTIQDSLKKLPFSVKQLAGAFNLDMKKGEIDYTMDRPVGYEPTEDEIDYVKNDVGIVAQSLEVQFNQGLKEMTIGADALKFFKDLTGKFRDNYPLLDEEVDTFCRRAYKGGYCYCSPLHQGKVIDTPGQVFDVNSMYPWAMRYKPLPYGKPLYFTGEYKEDKDYPLYIIHLVADFKLKDGKLPTVQVKNDFRFLAREYIRDSKGHLELYMTSVDLELFLDAYEIFDIKYIDGYKFRSNTHSFSAYIDHWMKVKQENTGALRTLAKLMLNSLYGKFAKNPDTTGKHPILVDGVVKLVNNAKETSETTYVPVGCFITAWSRWNLINSALVAGDRFCYCDTDSIHVIGMEPVEGLKIHETELGAWKQELVFNRAKYLHTKCYIEEYTDNEGQTQLKVTVSGLPSACRSQVTFDNFIPGATYSGKLLQRSVIGGVILEETTFTIKEDAFNE